MKIRYRLVDFVRKGECLQCGKCCKEKMPDCPHLNENGTCAIQETKPEECKLYPTHPMQLVEGCGFSFDRVETWKEKEI